MKISKNLLIKTSVAALLVIYGVVTKNSFEQLGMPDHPIGKPLGMGMFAVGWFYTAYILSLGKPNKLMFVLPSLAIIGSVVKMKEYMAKKETPPTIFPLAFAASWIILGLGVGNHLTGNQKYFGLSASLLVLASMMKVLPFQRENNVVDGPGLPMFVVAWFIIVILNSMRDIPRVALY